ncbi:BRI1 kinase inhibitor 1 [Raphanus sativus]|uniref:BRI1 kinase inhibitor 1 n=1 Tax=Raphanus sativus TaxID=3726 RepID=A0A6J0JHD3_RAPSA|nr:BRI1 kinase inhibitor 1 [Raphanus sativus]KAJ4888810.1 BRI1 kinase inhibitor 1 [Raphanus sativus]
METHLQQVKNSSKTFPEKQNPKQEALQSSPSPISSTCSSPSHDFSFTISLQPNDLSSSSKLISPSLRNPTKTKSSYPQTDPFAVDLSPADEIFFHGHLLPLHLLSHLPVSPRTSTSSYNDGFTLPVKDVLPDQPTPLPTTNNNISTEAKNTNTSDKAERLDGENQVKAKTVKSFSLFGLSKWRKGFEGNEREQEKQKQQQQKKKVMSLDLSHAVKKYIKMLFQKRGHGTQFRNRRQTSSYSFSSSLIGSKGNSKTLINGSRDLMKARQGDLFSAPASMRTSPTNSGHLRVSTAGLSSSSVSTSSSSDSTMEELQAAIQAAIAHCKNSGAVDRDDKVKDS